MWRKKKKKKKPKLNTEVPSRLPQRVCLDFVGLFFTSNPDTRTRHYCRPASTPSPSMSSPLSVKRRRLNDATNVLAKPFVSPLKRTATDRTAAQEQPTAAHAAHRPYAPSTLAHTISTSSPEVHKSQAVEQTVATPRPKTARARLSHTPITGSKRRDPEEVAAQKVITSLEIQIRSVRNELETLSQATQLSTGNTDDELVELTEKWKSAAQQAAEELFGSVHDRVCRMGGVAAWREAEKSKFDRQHGLGEYAQRDAADEDNDADCEFDSQGEELPEEEQEWRRKEKRRIRAEMAEAADVPAKDEGDRDSEAAKSMVWQEPGQEDDAFTMDMMLRSLNIELDVIGYDKREQRWMA